MARFRDSIKRSLSWLPHGVKTAPSYAKWSRFLSRGDRWPRDKVERWQTAQLRVVVRHAMAHTDGYRELYRAAGVNSDDLRSPADVRHLPIVTKEMLQSNLAAFSAPMKGAQYTSTGGSTGIPFGFLTTAKDGWREAAFMHHGWRRAGWKPEMRTVVLRGAFVGTSNELSRHDPFWNTLHLTSYYLTADTISRYVELLNDFRPDVIHAYPSSLLLLCDLLKEAGLSLRPAPRLAMLGSENLYGWQLQHFAEVIPTTRVFSWYGHTEMAVLAPWCEHGRRFHVSPFYGLAELVDESGAEVRAGAEGEIMGTSLHVRSTPFIRYCTMDIAVRGPTECPDCGRAHGTFDKINGRLQEVIVSRDGRYISMVAINFHDDIFELLRQFQFRQDEPGAILFQFVAKRSLSGPESENLARRLKFKLGEDIDLQLREVPEIPLTRNGKLRFLDQRVPIKYGDRA